MRGGGGGSGSGSGSGLVSGSRNSYGSIPTIPPRHQLTPTGSGSGSGSGSGFGIAADGRVRGNNLPTATSDCGLSMISLTPVIGGLDNFSGVPRTIESSSNGSSIVRGGGGGYQYGDFDSGRSAGGVVASRQGGMRSSDGTMHGGLAQTGGGGGSDIGDLAADTALGAGARPGWSSPYLHQRVQESDGR